MDIQSYISSGILEAYALGALTDQERTQVEADVAQYPELADELRAIEDSMIQFAQQDAQQPPAHLKEQIWNTIQQQETPKIKIEQPKEVNGGVHTARTIPLGPTAPKFNLQRAAIWVILIGSVAVNMVLFNRMKDMSERQKTASAKMDSLTNETLQLKKYAANYQMMIDSGMQKIVMKGASNDTTMAATVFADTKTGTVYLAMQNMPMPPKGMQYQLWVIKDGKPMSMGVVANDMITTQAMQKIPMQIAGGAAYAISLEKEGGVEVPTAVKVVGKV